MISVEDCVSERKGEHVKEHPVKGPQEVFSQHVLSNRTGRRGIKTETSEKGFCYNLPC